MSGIDYLTQGIDATQSMLTDLIATYYQQEAIKKAAKAQLAATGAAEGIATDYGEQAINLYKPYYDLGTGQWRTLNEAITAGTFNMPDYAANQPDYGEYKAPEFNFEQEPGYQFRQAEGQRAIESSAAARGSMLSGATQKALARYGQGLASEEYGNAFSRNMQSRQQQFSEYTNMRNFLFGKYNAGYNAQSQEMGNRYGRLASAASMGYNAGTNMSNATGMLGDTLSSLALRRGDIQAGQAVAAGNLAANRWQNQGQINSNFIQNTGGIGGGGGETNQNNMGNISSVLNTNSGESRNAQGQTGSDTDLINQILALLGQ